MEYFLYPFIILAGVLQAFGNPMNAQLKNSLENPWLASLVSFGLIVAFFSITFVVFPRPLPTASAIVSMPWWAPLGGMVGAVAVVLGLLYVGKVGAGAFAGILITSNLIASLCIDHFGLFNMPTHALNPFRVGGAILMVAGIFMISKF